MKNLYRIGIFLIICVITGLVVIYFFDRFVVGVKDIGKLPQIYESDEELEYYQSLGKEPPTAAPPEKESVDTGVVREEAGKTTLYVIEEYDRYTREKNVITERIPAQYIGMNREELEDALALYLKAPSLQDLERGLQEIRLASFSPEQIVVRKSYFLKPEPDLKSEPDRYYLTEEDGYVVVYYRNMENLFCETGIELESLPLRLQTEIREVKTIETEEELYAFLESYSS